MNPQQGPGSHRRHVVPRGAFAGPGDEDDHIVGGVQRRLWWAIVCWQMPRSKPYNERDRDPLGIAVEGGKRCTKSGLPRSSSWPWARGRRSRNPRTRAPWSSAARARAEPTLAEGDERGMGNTQGPGLAALRLPSRRSRRPGLGDLARALAHHAGLAVRGAARVQFPPDRGPARHAPRLQRRSRAASPGPRAPRWTRSATYATCRRSGTAKGDFPADPLYYGGFTQDEVKPAPDARPPGSASLARRRSSPAGCWTPRASSAETHR